MKTKTLIRLLASMLLMGWATSALRAADTTCAQVQIQILQKLTMERQGFEATLQVANSLSSPLSNFNVTLLFTDTNGIIVSSTMDSTAPGAYFWYKVQQGSPAVPSDVAANGAQTFKWLIVPSAGASQGSAQGTMYFVGATVTYTVNGVARTMQVAPDYVQVYPTPLLNLEYFLPEQVIGQDPGTPNMFLPPVPFPLGVRIRNSGMGAAKGLNILIFRI